MDIRVGHGVDIHPFGEGTFVTLGGVKIPHSHGLVGHSDADVLTHAIMDSLLGASGLPDIGHLFPNTDQQFAGADSLELLKQVVAEVSKKGWKVKNCDSAIMCEAPKIAPHVSKMKENLSVILGVSSDAVGIKATTAEKLGSIGRSEGLFVSSVSLLVKE